MRYPFTMRRDDTYTVTLSDGTVLERVYTKKQPRIFHSVQDHLLWALGGDRREAIEAEANRVIIAWIDCDVSVPELDQAIEHLEATLKS